MGRSKTPALPWVLRDSTAVRSTGVALLEAAEAALLPLALVATTVQLTATPAGVFTTIGEAPPVLLCEPQVAVKLVIALPPLLPGAAKATETLPLPAITVAPVGASGTCALAALLNAAVSQKHTADKRNRLVLVKRTIYFEPQSKTSRGFFDLTLRSKVKSR